MLLDPKWNKIDDTGQVLLDAANKMQKAGWAKGILSDDCGRVCAMGAIVAITGYGSDADVHKLVKAMDRLYCYLGMAPVDWNDRVCKNTTEATDALRAAAFHH
jgi:hypothetical protein